MRVFAAVQKTMFSLFKVVDTLKKQLSRLNNALCYSGVYHNPICAFTSLVNFEETKQ